GASAQRSLPVAPAKKHSIEKAGSFGLSEEFVAKSDQPARRCLKLQSNSAGAMINHLCHLALAASDRLGNDADKLFRTIDHNLFDRFEYASVGHTSYRFRLGHLQLVTFTTHHLD